jgi:hypothetical protein
MIRSDPKRVMAYLFAVACLIVVLVSTFGCVTNPSLTPIPVPYDINGVQPK